MPISAALQVCVFFGKKKNCKEDQTAVHNNLLKSVEGLISIGAELGPHIGKQR